MSVYTRNFSEIIGLQIAQTINYNLCTVKENDFVAYGIEVIDSFGKTSSKMYKIQRISCSKDYVLEILKFLYENSVKPDEAPYVVFDILNEKRLLEDSILVIN